jgi:hypothetical protein
MRFKFGGRWWPKVTDVVLSLEAGRNSDLESFGQLPQKPFKKATTSGAEIIMVSDNPQLLGRNHVKISRWVAQHRASVHVPVQYPLIFKASASEFVLEDSIEVLVVRCNNKLVVGEIPPKKLRETDAVCGVNGMEHIVEHQEPKVWVPNDFVTPQRKKVAKAESVEVRLA